MPKRVGFLRQKVQNKRIIRSTILKAARHKTKRAEVREVLAHLDDYAAELEVMLALGEYVPSAPTRRAIYDISSQKERVIESVPFWPDAVVQWLLVDAMKPVLMRGMCHWCCASIPGRGQARVHRRLKRALQNDPKGTKFAAEIDVRKYYPSVPTDRLMAALRRKIKDEWFLGLVEAVIRTGGDGLSIGYYINQWLANYYLEPLDRRAQNCRGVKYMTRYMDNLIILGPNKRRLHRARQDIKQALSALGLTMKRTWQIYRTWKRMVSAVGYRFDSLCIALRKRNALRLMRQSRRIQKRLAAGCHVSTRQAQGFLSRAGQLKHCDSLHLRQKYVDPIGVKKLKEVVRRESQSGQCAGCGVYGGVPA